MSRWAQNNLRKASSPYLRQHAENPVWWQEWDEGTLEYAREEKKPVFVSVGYSTCHWCHVMAQEAFSDPEVADYLNRYFVSIKVDREQRPDIDQYLMTYLMAAQGRGGWPLNAFLTPDLRPIYAMTYAPVHAGYGVPGFLEVLGKVKDFFDTSREKVGEFDASVMSAVPKDEGELRSKLMQGFDAEFGGYGEVQKFPPFCTLLFMLSYGYALEDKRLLRMCGLTLDPMALRGLHDHLQGGFFRYCVDREWTVPHFEKMLYDQAMGLWTYALAFGVLKKPLYKKVAEKIIVCLEETFAENGLYHAAHDADTEHEEGATYLWDEKELRSLLTPEEYERFCAVYEIGPGGNFEGKNHLLKKKEAFQEEIERKLLERRKRRPQPRVDRKLITSWNCLTGIALIHAFRFLGSETYLVKAEGIARALLERHYQGGRLAHSSCEGVLQKEEFLQDVAGLLLLFTFLQEEKGSYAREVDLFRQKMFGFKKEKDWIEGEQSDFREVLADGVDQPVPASASLAELADLRAEILRSGDVLPGDFKEPQFYDFYNLSVLIRNGFFHILTTPERIPWGKLPPLSIQIKGKEFRDCYEGVCRTTPSWAGG